MRITIFGAGGVGSVVAGHLARNGAEVITVARPGHAAAIKQKELTVTGLSDFHVPVPVQTDALNVESTDVLLITVKTTAMLAALEGTRHIAVGCVASLQNGVVKNAQLAKVFGHNKVLGSATMIGASLVRDGEVRYTLDGVTFFGEMHGARSDRSDRISGMFLDAGLASASVENIESIEWTKQMIQNPFATVATITRLPVHLVWSDPNLAALSIHMLREVAQVAKALKIALSEHEAWSLFDLKTLADGTFSEAVESLIAVGEKAGKSGRGHIVPSMLQDVLAGKPTEIEETVGHVLSEGKRLGISLPYTDFAYRTVKAIEANYPTRHK